MDEVYYKKIFTRSAWTSKFDRNCLLGCISNITTLDRIQIESGIW